MVIASTSSSRRRAKGSFTGPVSAKSVTTDAGGATEINANVTADQAITFNDDTTVLRTSVISTTTGQPVSFKRDHSFQRRQRDDSQ